MVRFLKRGRNFSVFQNVQNSSEAHPDYSIISGGLPPGVKRSDSEADHSRSSSAKNQIA